MIEVFAEVLGRKETQQLRNQGEWFPLKYNLSNKVWLYNQNEVVWEWHTSIFLPYKTNIRALKIYYALVCVCGYFIEFVCFFLIQCWSTGMSLLWTSQHSEKKYWIRSDLLTVFWVSRFKQKTNIPIGNYFPGLAWKKESNAWILLKKKIDQSQEYSKEKRI